MTPAQLSALKADIQASFAAEYAAGQYNIIAEAYNALAAPDFYVWKTSLAAKEMHESGYVWSELDALTQAKYNQLSLMLSQGVVNPSKANVRQGFLDIFAGAGFATTRTALVALAKRKATVAEKLFATGTGSEGSPAELSFEGSVSSQTIMEAMSNG